MRYFKLENTDNVYKLVNMGKYYSWWVFDSKVREWHFGSFVEKENVSNLYKNGFYRITKQEAFIDII